ncbi:ABC transporter substrate-binding protein [Paenibacillus nasutitermitis]|uniref:Multiple sugar transport system substrate-binding protein n=1 Tax=Paenibacillus nasutitermitis TaxID=1652958 RepID=A0A917E2H2_9BACL|nr:sugar ABC transporter substrate-binding protein [Paenibacillus nasutitermitis]GGD96705.1 hypothetical protein GCM10010911_64350 [Paenibacillus nasutitermitis]
MGQRRVVSTVTVMIIMIVLILSACSNAKTNNTNNEPGQQNTKSEDNKAAEGNKATNEGPKDSGKPTTIRFTTWYGAGDIEIWKEVIKRFEADNPLIKVQFEPLDFAAYWQKIPTQLAGNASPDVIGMHVGIVYSYVQKNQLEPLDAYLSSSEHQADELPDALVAEGQWPKDNPQQFALPWHFTGGTLYINKTAFEEAGVPYPENGWTIEEFVAAAKKLTTDKRFGFQVPGFTMNAGLLAAFGGVPTTEDRLHSNYNSPEMLAYKTWLHDLIYKEKVSPNPKDLDASVDPFVAGKVAMTVGGAWNFPVYRKIKDFDWDVAPMPTKDGVSKTYAGPDLLSIPKDSKNKEAAWKFMQFAIFDPKSQELLRQTGLPMLKKDLEDESVVNEIASQKPEHFKVFLDGAINNGTGYAFTPKFFETAGFESDADVKILQKENVDIQKVLDELHDKVNKELEKK